jgi:molybdate transport repressor ModE-like protein
MPPVRMEWESRLGRRLRLRELHLLSTVVRCGSMAKAARELAMSQPAVSEAIANLEDTFRVPLLDRSPRGIEPTIYADALLKRSVAVFDELKQSVRDIEFLANPTVGQLIIGCPESIAATVLPRIVERFSQQHPHIVLHIEDVDSPALRAPSLRDRRHDLILARQHPVDVPIDDLNIEPLFDDPFVVAAGPHTQWARRRKVEFAELVGEQWILPPTRTWNFQWLAREFKARGLGIPNATMVTFNAHLNSYFLKKGAFLTVRPRSWVLQEGLAVVPVNVALPPMPVALVTLKNRTLSPIVERFAECAREVAKSIVRKSRSRA